MPTRGGELVLSQVSCAVTSSFSGTLLGRRELATATCHCHRHRVAVLVVAPLLTQTDGSICSDEQFFGRHGDDAAARDAVAATNVAMPYLRMNNATRQDD